MTRARMVVVVAIAAATAALATLFWQVEVTGSDASPARACGSAFDSVADRSGWQQWWAQDLDDADLGSGAELVRTRRCPDAVNRRTAIAAVLGGLAVAAGLLAVRPSTKSHAGSSRSRQLERIGTIATASGVALSIGGLAAIVLLVADADSTLFLYTDRLVVAIVGLIALVPAMALGLGGWALRNAVLPSTEAEDDAA